MCTPIKYLVFVFCYFFVVVNSSAQTIHLNNWKYQKADSKKWHEAKVPGVIHTDLFRNKEIQDPLVNDNEKKLQWIGESDWNYQCLFICDESTLAKAQIDLLFEGLDTYADVYLNDSLILESDNMFRSYRVDVKNIVKSKNVLLVKFKAPEKIAKKAAASLTYTLPEGLRSFTRKAQFQYGWDFAPKFLTCGMWKPVSLIATDPISLISLRIQQKQITGDHVSAVAYVKVKSTTHRKSILNLKGLNSNTNIIHEVIIQKGEQSIAIPFTIPQVQLWNINGKGNQALYNFVCTIDSDTSEKVFCNSGFRNIQFVNAKDSIGSEFGFEINGKAIFTRGANMVPPHVFLTEAKDNVYESLVLKARDAGMNMLRVWGGGVYLPDAFYNYCDQYGIMVWQDFMFACSMVPGDETFVENVRREAIEQVERLSSHPCIVLWCGNNENDEGWKNWGWQKQFSYSASDSAKIWNDYKKIFQAVLPAVIDSLDPNHAYVSSSPLFGWGRKESMTNGDSHYWGVWWGMEDFEIYKKKTGRFMSEYGFQSMPNASSFSNHVNPLSLTSTEFLNHQKHPRGFETINHSLKTYFKVPTSFDDYAYLTQLQQSYAMDIATKSHRRSFPTCMGTLFWQFNDCWPAVSWSSLDFNQNEKLFYQTAKHNYDSLFVNTDETEKGLSTYLHFDGRDDISITVRLYYMRTDIASEPIGIDERYLILKPDTVIKDCIFFPSYQMRNLDSTNIVIVTEVVDNFHFNVIYRDYYFRARPNRLHLQKAEVKVTALDESSLVITSDVFTFGLYLYDEQGQCTFEENGFHLHAGERKIVQYLGPADKIRWKCWNNLMNSK